MAKILYLVRYPMHKEDNLTAKFNGQMAAMKALGHSVYFIGWDTNSMRLIGDEKEYLLVKTPLSKIKGYWYTMLYIDLMKALRKASELVTFDIVYMRYMPTFPGAKKAIESVKKTGARLIVEYPTFPAINGQTTSWIRKPVFQILEREFKHIKPMVDGYVAIGEDCGGVIDGVTAINVINGVQARSYPLHQNRKETGSIGILALASMSKWQGYDRFIESMDSTMTHVTLHMVGGDGDGSLPEWKQLAAEKNLQTQVVFHGELHGKQLEEVIAQCDVGLGGLRLYLKDQFQSMPLKLREYMARGLPFVYAVDDPSMPDNDRFCMKLPNDNTPIDIIKILDFAKKSKTDDKVGADMKAYAIEHLSWEAMMNPIFERFEIL